jgi:hypothetical protein
MGTETFNKNGQVSKKKHVAKGQGKEHYKTMYEPCPTLGGGPDYFERKYNNKYRKTSLPAQEAVDDMGPVLRRFY